MKRTVVNKTVVPVSRPKLERTKSPIAKEALKVDEIEPTIEQEIPVADKRDVVVMTKLPVKEIEKIPEPELPMHLKLRYRKEGGGTFTIFKRVYKKGDIIEAYPEQIPEAFMDSLVCISSPEEQKQAIAESKGIAYSIEFMYIVTPSIPVGSFNVINTETKKQINEKQLSKADADKLCQSLNT